MTDSIGPMTFKVTGAHNTEKEYGLNIGWKVDLVAPDGTAYPDCFSLKKRGNGFKVNDEVYGHLEPGEYGMRFKGDPLPGGGFQGGGSTSQTRPATSSRPESPGPEFWAAKDKRIGRAGVLQAVVSASQLPASDGVEAYVIHMNHITDALIASLDQATPSPNDDADGGLAGTTGPRVPVDAPGASAPAVSAEPATANQKRAATNIFRKAQVTDEVARLIVHKLAGSPPSKAGMSHVLDVLMGDSDLTTDQRIERLMDEAEVMAPSDVPLDEAA